MIKMTYGKIARELALLIEAKQALCKTDKEKRHAVTIARTEINAKYGKDWRTEYAKFKAYDFSKPSQAQDLGDEWDDYAWGAEDF